MAQIITKICLDAPIGCEKCNDRIHLILKDEYKPLVIDDTGHVVATLVSYSKEISSSQEQYEVDCATGCKKLVTKRCYKYCYLLSYDDVQLAPTATITEVPSPLTCLHVEDLCCFSCSEIYLIQKFGSIAPSVSNIDECVVGYFTGATV